MKNHLLKQRRVEKPSLRKEFSYQPSKFALAQEIRNPLTNINLAVGMLRSMTNIDDQEKCLDIISRASCKIEVLIHSILTPTRLKAKQPAKHSIHKLLDEVLVDAVDRT